MTIASIPSPTDSVWQVGFLTIRAYALCIILGIVVACYVMERRMRARGAHPWAVLDVAVWAVPFGIIGARIYHVISSPQQYFGENGHPLEAFKIWEGGLGVWGSVAGGALGAWLAARQMGLPFGFVADTLAPGLALAQAVGRWGNWFNNELHGDRTDLPWGVQIHEMEPGNPGQAVMENGHAVLLPGTYHPTFLYESIWDVGVAVLVWLVDRKYKLGKGRAFALYVMAYTAGRGWIEAMRIDEASHILGLRLNIWTSIIVFLGGLIYFVRVRGPQQFVVPLVADGQPVGRTDGRPGERPKGYLEVTDQQFRRYQETGELPDVPEAEPPAADKPADEAEDSAEPAAGEPAGEGPGDRRPAAQGAEAGGGDDR